MYTFKKMCYSFIKYYSIYVQIILKYIHPCVCIYIYKIITHSTHTYIMQT